MFSVEKHTVPILAEKKRLSDYAVGIFQAISSRKGIKKAIAKGYISINGKAGHSGDYIHGHEILELSIPKLEHKILKLKLEVLFEDEFLAIINKPAGISVSGNMARNIQNALPYNLKISQQPDSLERMEPIHRLDYPTSGVLLIGKTRSITITLNRMFENRDITKIYHAVTIAELRAESPLEWLIDQKASHTEFTVLRSIVSNRYQYLNLLELHPTTGRKHQIRQHLSMAKSPILGDRIYGPTELFPKGTGLYLHASSLSFIHPITNETLYIEANLPLKFQKIF